MPCGNTGPLPFPRRRSPMPSHSRSGSPRGGRQRDHRAGRQHALIRRSRLWDRAASLRPYLVELPGLERAAKSRVSWGNGENYDAKRCEKTCGYAERVDAINIITAALPPIWVGKDRQPRPSSPKENRHRTPNELPRRTGRHQQATARSGRRCCGYSTNRLRRAMPDDAFASQRVVVGST